MSTLHLRIQIRASCDVLLDGFNVSFIGSSPNIHTRPTPHQHNGCDCCVISMCFISFSFQFCTRLAAVFAEEIGEFWLL